MIGTDAEAKRLQRTIWTAAAAAVIVLAVYGIVQYVTYKQQMDAMTTTVQEVGKLYDKIPTPAPPLMPR